MFSIGLLSMVLLVPSAAAQQPVLGAYEPVLLHLQQRNVNKPLVLYSTIVKYECVRGGCGEPWAGELPLNWLQKSRSAELVRDFCKYQGGRCVRSSGEQVVIRDAVWVMFSTADSCGTDCLRLMARHIEPTGERSARQRDTLYTLTSVNGRWCIQKAEQVAAGFLDG